MIRCTTTYQRRLWRGWLLCAVLWTHQALPAAESGSKHLTSSPRAPEMVLAQRHINGDALPDTLIGVSVGKLYLPTAIRWGRDETASVSQPVRQTEFLYPDWDGLSGSFSVLRYNPEDTLSDMIWHLRGTTTAAEAASRSCVIFGQSCLDRMRYVDIAAMQDIQTQPYCAARLIEGETLVDGRRRDLSERKSYLMKRMQLPIDIAADREAELPGVDFRLFPNPASSRVRLSARNLPAGSYSIQVVAVDGTSHMERVVEIGGDSEVDCELNLERLPSGFYIVELRRSEQRVGALTMVVAR